MYIYMYTCIHMYICTYIHIHRYTDMNISDLLTAMPPQEQPVADPMGAPKIKATPCQALLSVRILPWSRVGERARDRG